ncbi:MAG: hypothetical protein AAGA54_27825 [Myxococcota bacterium]
MNTHGPWIAALLVAALGGCSGDVQAEGDSFSDYMPDDLPAGGCRDTDRAEDEPTGGLESCDTDATTSTGAAETGSSSGGPESSDACEGSQDCNGNESCAATWDPQAQARGPLACQFACIPALDDASWCSDDAACCDAAARCTERGYCVVEDETGGSTGGGSTGTDA